MYTCVYVNVHGEVYTSGEFATIYEATMYNLEPAYRIVIIKI